MLQPRNIIILSFVLCLAAASAAFAQDIKKQDKPKTVKVKTEKPKPVDLKNLTAEQLAETVLIAYGGIGGRNTLAQIRKSEIERGEIKRFAADQTTVTEKSTYEKRTMRGETLDKDRVRIDQKLPQAEYTLIYDTAKTFGIINGSNFAPRDEAGNSFQANIFYTIESLLRYKENGSTLKLVGKDKMMGVEFYTLELTDKQKRTIRFNVSAKLYRVQSLEFETTLTDGAKPTKFVRRYYDYRPAQGTLAAFRSTLAADGKLIEETNILTITYGTKIEDAQFQPAQSAE